LEISCVGSITAAALIESVEQSRLVASNPIANINCEKSAERIFFYKYRDKRIFKLFVYEVSHKKVL
jgi:hypothetical protein